MPQRSVCWGRICRLALATASSHGGATPANALDLARARRLQSQGPEDISAQRWSRLPRRSGPAQLSPTPRAFRPQFRRRFAFCQGFVVFVDLETRLNLIAGDLRRVFNPDLTPRHGSRDRLLREGTSRSRLRRKTQCCDRHRRNNQLKAICKRPGRTAKGSLSPSSLATSPRRAIRAAITHLGHDAHDRTCTP